MSGVISAIYAEASDGSVVGECAATVGIDCPEDVDCAWSNDRFTFLIDMC